MPEKKSAQPEKQSAPKATVKKEEPPKPEVVDGPHDWRSMLEIQAGQGDKEAKAALKRVEAKEKANMAREAAALEAEDVRQAAGL
jgi:hypothetical protein